MRMCRPPVLVLVCCCGILCESSKARLSGAPCRAGSSSGLPPLQLVFRLAFGSLRQARALLSGTERSSGSGGGAMPVGPGRRPAPACCCTLRSNPSRRSNGVMTPCDSRRTESVQLPKSATTTRAHCCVRAARQRTSEA